MIDTLRVRGFALLWIGGLISVLGDWILFVALPYFIYQQTGSVLATSIMFVAEIVPAILFGSVAGVLVDRWDRRRTLVVVNLIQALATLPLLTLALLSVDEWLWLAYVVTFLQKSLSRFSTPAENALLPDLVDETHRISANALNALNDNVARLIGPPIGGSLIVFCGLESVVIVDSLTFLVAAILIAGIPSIITSNSESSITGATHAPDNNTISLPSIWNDWSTGIGIVYQNRVVRGIFRVSILIMLSNTLRLPVLIPFIEEVLDGGAIGFGVLIAAQGTGGLIGGALIGRAGSRVNPAILIVVGELMIGCCIVLLVGVPSLPLAVMLLGLIGVSSVAQGVGVQTILQGSVPSGVRGRIYGTMGTLLGFVGLAGYLVAGAAGDRIGTATILGGTGLLDIIAGVTAISIYVGASFRNPSAS